MDLKNINDIKTIKKQLNEELEKNLNIHNDLRDKINFIRGELNVLKKLEEGEFNA